MTSGHGGVRPGSGRPKGSHTGARLRSRLSAEQQDRAGEAVRMAVGAEATFAGDAYALLSFIYRNEALPITLRMRAAETAIGYERPKLARVEVKEEATGPTLIEEILLVLEGSGRGLPSETAEALPAPTEAG